MKRICIVAFMFLISNLVHTQEEYPSGNLSNEHLEVQVFLPDAEEGFYRATRFDWSGVIGSLQYKGHEYFDPWLDYHDPLVHEAITGPVEAFYPMGFEEAKPGDDFLVIGVGALERADEEPYHFSKTYKILNGGKWKVKKKKDNITFQHKIQTADGYGYSYSKSVRLDKETPTLQLIHKLKNTGTQTIQTTCYNHNFFVIDREPTGPNIITRFSHAITAEGKGFGGEIIAQDSSLIFTRQLESGENVFCKGLEAVDAPILDYDIRIENRSSRAGVRITGDRPLLKLPFWACSTTSCPEPYLSISIEPGESYSWQINYTFYEIP